MHVELLAAADAARYRTLMLQAYTLAPDAFTSTAEERAAEPEAFWVRRIGDPLSAAFGAFSGAELVGTVALEFSAKPKTKHKALLLGMYVAPTARVRGAGRALLHAAIDHARARPGVRLLTLTATDGNAPAIALYRSAGFRAFGVEPLAILTPSGFKAKVHMALQLDQPAPPAPRPGFAGDTANRSMPASTVIPVLHYADVPAAVRQLCACFGFSERLRIGGHRVQLNVGEGAVVAAHGDDRADAAHSVMVRVADVDAHFARARAAGAKLLSEPATQVYGERQYSAVDDGGHVWTFSQSVADADPAAWGGELVAG